MLPSLRRAQGRIVFVGSIAGRSALPFTGAYCASKFAIEAIADSLRIELRPWQMRVSVIEPGVVITPIWDTATRAADLNLGRMPQAVNEYYGAALDGLRKRLAHGLKGVSPDDVARVIENALTAKRPRARYVVGNDARLRTILRRLPTPLHDRLIALGVRMMEKSGREPTP
jgi:NAD(P)-dependent dehydrogenase (short-subunit alcohol dehydrogenase family)